MKKWLKSTLIITSLSLLVLAIPFSLFIVSSITENPYAKTYYGELIKMHERLKKTLDKKIVFLGNSSVAFGTDSKLIEDELQKQGRSYEVVNFGLYGSIGTKAMLDLSKKHINEGDIVILSIEEYPQSMSTFLDPLEIYRSTNGDFSMIGEIDKSYSGEFVAEYPTFISEKLKLSQSSNEIEGIYKQASFDDRCDLKNHPRDYNTMPDGYDSNNLIDLSALEISDSYIQMINDYTNELYCNGASIYYSFAPMNKDSIIGYSRELLDSFASKIDAKINCPLFMNPNDAVYEPGYFYDSNFHLNYAGMTCHSIDLMNGLKTILGDSSPTDLVKPAMPKVPDEGYIEENSTDESCFEYEEKGETYIITSIKDESLDKEEFIIPSMHDGKPVISFSKDTFVNNSTIKQITLQKNIRKLEDSSFDGCSNLSTIKITQTNPDRISVGYSLLEGTTNVEILVPQKGLSSYRSHYFWGHYNENIKAF